MPGFPHHSKYAGGLGKGPPGNLVIWLVVVCGIVLIIVLLAGCSDTETPRTDLDENNIDLISTPWTVYANYDEFPNVAVRCDGTTRMYTTTRVSDALELVPDHELCQGGDE